MSNQHPVYILGAGFSKAISPHMPVTQDLAIPLKERIKDKWMQELDGQRFEKWLTQKSLELPFLSEYEIFERKSQVSRILLNIAEIIQNLEQQTCNNNPPEWAYTLINKWIFEKAKVITLNYDTLVEKLVNSNSHKNFSEENNGLWGDQVVFPKPPSHNNGVYHVGDGTYALESMDIHSEGFQLIKLHGSLNWFISNRDTVGATLVRESVNGSFKSEKSETSEMFRLLDPYIIPPVLNKDSFYGTYLSQMLWKSAREAIHNASSITFMGYSLPAEDIVTSELISNADAEIPVTVADLHIDKDEGILKNLLELGFKNISKRFSGENCVSDYVLSCTQGES